MRAAMSWLHGGTSLVLMALLVVATTTGARAEDPE